MAEFAKIGNTAERKAEFKKYLEQTGVMDAIVKALVKLYGVQEKPADPLDFVRKELGVSGGTADQDEKIKELTAQNEDLKQRLSKYEAVDDISVKPSESKPSGKTEATPESVTEKPEEETPKEEAPKEEIPKEEEPKDGQPAASEPTEGEAKEGELKEEEPKEGEASTPAPEGENPEAKPEEPAAT